VALAGWIPPYYEDEVATFDPTITVTCLPSADPAAVAGRVLQVWNDFTIGMRTVGKGFDGAHTTPPEPDRYLCLRVSHHYQILHLEVRIPLLHDETYIRPQEALAAINKTLRQRARKAGA